MMETAGPFKNITFPTPKQIVYRKAKRHKGFLIGGTILLFIIFMAISAPILAPHDPYEQNLDTRLIVPVWHAEGTWNHILGTDNLGRDYLSRLMYGARISLLIGVAAMLISGVIGTILGVSAGYFGGRVDMIVSAIISIRLALPIMLVALAVVALVGGSLMIVVLVLGLMIWNRFALVMRASTQQLRSMDYVNAAKTSGCSTLRIILTEVMPNILNNLIVVATLEITRAILIEASLSFLGMGVQPPLPSWGLMVNEAKGFMLFSPWMIMIPGTAIFALVISINLLGDGVRDITAPEGR
ncbi:MAG: ABC transporter permease [Desulfobacula sp.]|jgi:peptide/nickel transport system permease protein|uniref:ABC transporter permease n=1 Tax=Desulfobacula sp. TaxID=2593537 RepID=UPI001DE6EE5D|nr:ABC transporter permease [Desulfobacula sp.]MBT3485286.1 ABC transporter permease [Desulfobacula sp.]MBT3803654.1 ABC transporter permease [Desulfobacula sp.]MBT4024229.1 ABC transporter permease [Desulfobacula sp.]MBT4199295.1 ABC transporter permease [Desulfobacula sp.]